MKALEVCCFAIITTFQLALCLAETCGETKFVQVFFEMKNVSKLHFPWAGALYSVVNKSQYGEEKYICGATLLTKFFGITAAHCINDKTDGYCRAPGEIIAYFGFYDLKQKNVTGTEISHIIPHPDWNPQTESYDADIALLRFKDEVTFSSTISPICLWHEEDIQAHQGVVASWTDLGVDDPGYWNYNHDLLHNYPIQFNLPIRSSTECFLMQPRFKAISSERTFCAGGLNSGQCLEVGNSGAAMSIQIGEKNFMKGIVSASFIDIAGCDNVTFTLFTDVLKFRNWMIDIIKE